MTALSRRLSPAKLAEARRRYVETRELIDSIARYLGVGSRTFHTLARKLNWRRRNAPRPSSRPLPAPSKVPAPAVPPLSPAAARIAERIQCTVERELAAIEQIVATFEPASVHIGDAERAARVLASLTRTLQEVMRLNDNAPQPGAGEHADNDRGPADPDEFVRELARRMDAFAAAHAGARIPDAGEGGVP